MLAAQDFTGTLRWLCFKLMFSSYVVIYQVIAEIT